MRRIALAITILIVLPAALIIWLWLDDIATDRKYKLEILEPITLVKYPPQNYSKKIVEIGKIYPGDSVEVRRMGYGKDFRAWCVRGPKGQEGWFKETGGNVRITYQPENSSP